MRPMHSLAVGTVALLAGWPASAARTSSAPASAARSAPGEEAAGAASRAPAAPGKAGQKHHDKTKRKGGKNGAKKSGKKGKKKKSSTGVERYGLVYVDLEGNLGVGIFDHYGRVETDPPLDELGVAMGFSTFAQGTLSVPLVKQPHFLFAVGGEVRAGTSVLSGRFSQSTVAEENSALSEPSSLLGGATQSSMEYDLRRWGAGVTWEVTSHNVAFTGSRGRLFGTADARSEKESKSVPVEAPYWGFGVRYFLPLNKALALGAGAELTQAVWHEADGQSGPFLPLAVMHSAPLTSITAAVMLRWTP